MKKKLIAITICVAMLSATLCGCASSSDTSATTTAPTEPIVTVEKEEPEVTEPVKVEEPKEEKTEPEAEPVKVEEPKEEKTEPEAEPKETESDDSTKTAEEVSQEDLKEETPQEDSKEEVSTGFGLGDLDAYISKDGVFDAEKYGWDIGATEVYLTGNQFDYAFGDVWFVECSSSGQSTEKAYIAVGTWQKKYNQSQYSNIYSFGESISLTNGATVSKNTLLLLPIVINYMKQTQDPFTAPAINGETWGHCEEQDPFIQR